MEAERYVCMIQEVETKTYLKELCHNINAHKLPFTKKIFKSTANGDVVRPQVRSRYVDHEQIVIVF